MRGDIALFGGELTTQPLHYGQSSVVSDRIFHVQTCQYLHNLIATSVELQYTLTLSAEGLIYSFPTSSSTNHPSIGSRLDILADSSTAWRTAQHKHTISMVEHTGGRGWDLKVKDGVAVLKIPSRLFVYWLPPNPQSVSDISRKADTEEGGERTDEGIRIVRKAFEDIELLPDEWGFDPSQDLLVFIADEININGVRERRVKARTLSENRPHPEAKRADVLWPRIPVSYAYHINVVGDLVVFSCSWMQEVVVWDWRGGDFIAVSLSCYFIVRVCVTATRCRRIRST